MPDIALSLIDPNPFRDFDLHPIDEAHVERLRASIERLGFWVGVVARPAVGGRCELAFGHHRIEAARRAGLAVAPVTIDILSDCQMALRLSVENAVQRGATAAASLDAIAGLTRLIIRECLRCGSPDEIVKIFTISPNAAQTIWGKIRAGGFPGHDCIASIVPEGTYSLAQIRLALGVLKDSGRLDRITGNDPPPTFDANCARLFKLDYHLSEFRRIVTGEVVRSYLPVDKQFSFAQQILAELGDQELTAIKLRERANVIFYEQLGMPRSAMRASSKRGTDARITDALNLLRRGVHGVKRGSAMLGDILGDGTVLSAMAHDRIEGFADEIEAALAILRPQPRSRLRVITKGRDVA